MPETVRSRWPPSPTPLTTEPPEAPVSCSTFTWVPSAADSASMANEKSGAELVLETRTGAAPVGAGAWALGGSLVGPAGGSPLAAAGLGVAACADVADSTGTAEVSCPPGVGSGGSALAASPANGRPVGEP